MSSLNFQHLSLTKLRRWMQRYSHERLNKPITNVTCQCGQPACQECMANKFLAWLYDKRQEEQRLKIRVRVAVQKALRIKEAKELKDRT